MHLVGNSCCDTGNEKTEQLPLTVSYGTKLDGVCLGHATESLVSVNTSA